MKRRTFLQMGLAAMAASTLPMVSLQEATAASNKPGPMNDLAPRRVELLDAGWRFLIEEPTLLTTPVSSWIWTPGTPDQEAAMIAPVVDTSGPNWKATTPGEDTLPENSYGWFRTTLPDIKGPGRSIHFESVDDNGTVYLNGTKLKTHTGWDTSFDVDLDSAWIVGGPNVLAVLVQNLGGGGGITQAVTIGTLNPHQDYSSAAFDDRSWRTVHLPHDFVVEGVFDPLGDVGHGALPKKLAWYRKRFEIAASDRGKSIWLHFEGVYRNATIFVNGVQVHFQDDGYDPFLVDIGANVNYGADNLLAVHVDPRQNEGWWYEGAGIYRHVWLNVASPVHVIPWGVYVTSDVSNVTTAPSANLTIQTDLTNDGATDLAVTVGTTIVGADGSTVATASSSTTVPGSGQQQVMQTVAVSAAALWSLETRNLYEARTTVTANNVVIDQFRQTFGIRTIRFDPDHGFFLNELPVKLQGTCNHQDFCGVGIGMTDSILYWRMQKLKERLNCNAIRCSHNPMTPAMYDACDALGLLVMDETRHPGDDPVAKASLSSTFANTAHIETMIRRDRNHPSVIMWSMANEEGAIQGDPYGAEMMTALMAAVHKHDTTRPVTAAENYTDDNGWLVGFASVEDIVGVNYYPERYDWLHPRYPSKMIYGSEIASDTFCRGIYKTDDAAAHLTSYHSPENSWAPVGTRDFVAGGFVWTGFDYRGEPNPYKWPEISSNFGLLDLCGFPKDAAYWYKAWWGQETPMVYIFPHWNWAGQEGQNISVWSYSNCDQVELFLDGMSQGSKDMPKFGHLQWDAVAYQPGALKAIGYRAGVNVAAYTVETTGPAAGIKLTADRTMLIPNGEDAIPVEVAIVDASGRTVPTASNVVSFVVTGAGVNAGVGNGDPASHELNQAPTRSAFAGLCMVVVKSIDKPGNVTLTASADGLTNATLQFAPAPVGMAL